MLLYERDVALARIALKYQPPAVSEEWNTIFAERASYDRRFDEPTKELQQHEEAITRIPARQAEWDSRYRHEMGGLDLQRKIFEHLKSDVAAYLRGD